MEPETTIEDETRVFSLSHLGEHKGGPWFLIRRLKGLLSVTEIATAGELQIEGGLHRQVQVGDYTLDVVITMKDEGYLQGTGRVNAQDVVIEEDAR